MTDYERGYAAALAEVRAKVEALPEDCHDWYGEGGCAALGCSAIERAEVLALLDAPAPSEPHRHRYGLVPVWTADRSRIESWWWCTDHPAGEWVKQEDDDGPAHAIPGWAALRGEGAPAPSEPGLDAAAIAEALRKVLPADVVYAIRPTGDPFGEWGRAVAARLRGEQR